jgi:hypothetical protein
MGHSLQTLLTTYLHVIKELKGSPAVPAEARIRAARDELVPLTYPRRAEGQSG